VGETKPKKRFRLEKFASDVLYDSVVSITSGALRWAGPALLALMVTSIRLGWDVPAWTLVLVLLGAIGLISLTKRLGDREPDELEARLEAAEDRLDRHDSYGTNICSIMNNFQRHTSDLRMSVLLAEEGDFVMEWASGHDIQSQKKYRQSIAKTVSRIAYEMKVMQVWEDVTVEERGFEANPQSCRNVEAGEASNDRLSRLSQNARGQDHA